MTDRRLTALGVWAAILIPINTMLIPYVYKQLWPEHDLVCEEIGPVSVGDTTMLELRIVNQGERIEKNVRISFPAHDRGLDDIILDEKSVNVSKPAHDFVISIDELDPKGVKRIPILLRKGSLTQLSIKSDESIVRFGTPNEFLRHDEQKWIVLGGLIFAVTVIPFGIIMSVYEEKKPVPHQSTTETARSS